MHCWMRRAEGTNDDGGQKEEEVEKESVGGIKGL